MNRPSNEEAASPICSYFDDMHSEAMHQGAGSRALPMSVLTQPGCRAMIVNPSSFRSLARTAVSAAATTTLLDIDCHIPQDSSSNKVDPEAKRFQRKVLQSCLGTESLHSSEYAMAGQQLLQTQCHVYNTTTAPCRGPMLGVYTKVTMAWDYCLSCSSLSMLWSGETLAQRHRQKLPGIHAPS